MQLPLAVVRAIRAKVGPAFAMVYRLSLIDLVQDGQHDGRDDRGGASAGRCRRRRHQHRHRLARRASPRSARSCRPAFRSITGTVKRALSIPVIASNRINTPELGEDIVTERRRGHGVDGAALPRRRGVRREGGARRGRRDQHVHRLQPGLPRPHVQRPARHLPRESAREAAKPNCASSLRARRGASPSSAPASQGLAAATTTAERDHRVVLYEASNEIGGQFRLAMRIPGKEDFAHTLRYFRHRIAKTGVDLRLGAQTWMPSSRATTTT